MSRAQDKAYGIVVRYEPPHEIDTIADVVFVHGLTGNANNTWATEKGSLHWPTQLLCEDITDIRISTFGYDADVVSIWNPVSQNRIGNHAENMLGGLARLRERTNMEPLKIIFVAHSLGGLLVESALDISRGSTEPHIQQLELCTIGICFLGTPHIGSDLAQWGTFGASIIKIVKRANKDIVNVLRPGSEMLAGIQKRFYNVLNHRINEGSRIAITCFYEELPMLVGGMVVPERFATLPGYSNYGIHANHREMTKFGSRADSGYIDIVGEIQRWIKAVRSAKRTPELTIDQEDCLKSLHFPSLTTRQDTARDAGPQTFEWIWSIEDSRFMRWLHSGHEIFWISGKPGSGKTTMMKYMAANAHLIKKSSLSLDSGPSVTEGDHGSQINRDLILAVHFFDHEGDDLAKSVAGLLRSLLFQLLRARPQLLDVISSRHLEMKRFHAELSWSRKDLETGFKAMLRRPECGPVLFFIDALDEASVENSEIIELINDFSKMASSTTRFCVSSRPSADFSFHFAGSEAAIRIDEHTSHDIHQFIHTSFHGLVSRSNMDYGSLIDQVLKKADNVFLWVRLVVENLLRGARRKETIDRLHQRLIRMPAGLDSFYQRMIDEASDYERSELVQILGVILCATRPLSLEELQDALDHCAKKVATHQTYPEAQRGFHCKLSNTEDFAETIQFICSGLVDVRTTYHPTGTRRAVAFSHHTVKEFIENLEDRGTTRDHSSTKAQGNLDLLRACVDCMTTVNISGMFRSTSSDEQPRSQGLAQEDTSPYLKIEWPPIEGQPSWTEAELNVQAFVICPFLGYAFSHWAQHAKNVETETNTSSRTILNKLAPINFTLWSSLMQDSDKCWSGIEGRRIVTPSTLFELAIVFGLARYVEEEILSYTTDLSERSKSMDHLLLDLNMKSGRLLYAAATGGSVEIAETLLLHGAKIDNGLRYASSALARAVYRGNFEVANVFCEHGALSNAPGIYLEGYPTQNQYRKPDTLLMRIKDQPLCLEATPAELLASHANVTPSDLSFYECPDFDKATIVPSVDTVAQISVWGPEIAIDDIAVSFASSISDDREPATYVLDQEASDLRSCNSMLPYILTMNLLSNQDIQAQLELLRKYRAAYGRLPKLNITAFNLSSAVPLELTAQLLNLGYVHYEHWSGMVYCDTFSTTKPIPTLGTRNW